MGIRTLQ